MKIACVIPGTGGAFYCENCVRDLSLVRGLTELGHEVRVIPMYLPVMPDEPHMVPESPVFYGAVRLYLEHRWPGLRRLPFGLRSWLDRAPFLKLAARQAGSTRAEGLEELTISMLRGEQGSQAAELERLVRWLHTHFQPDVVHISNGLLLGLARRLREALDAKVVCSLQDEDFWVDAMPGDYPARVWALMAERAADATCVPVSRYFADRVRQRLEHGGREAEMERQRGPSASVKPSLLAVGRPSPKASPVPARPSASVKPGLLTSQDARFRVTGDAFEHVVPLGVDSDRFHPAPSRPATPVIGYLSRLNEELGLGVLIEAFMMLKQNPAFQNARLRLAGGSTGVDKPFIKAMRDQLEREGLLHDVDFVTEFDPASRAEFLQSLTLLSVPMPKGEAFGLFQLEAMACGVPVVMPGVGGFPEVAKLTGGSRIYEPNDATTLAATWKALLTNPAQLAALAQQGLTTVRNRFTIRHMAERMSEVYKNADK